jgi:hypothetical protein
MLPYYESWKAWVDTALKSPFDLNTMDTLSTVSTGSSAFTHYEICGLKRYVASDQKILIKKKNILEIFASQISFS